MDILLDAGANPSTADIHGAYPIHYAAQMCGPNSGKSTTVCQPIPDHTGSQAVIRQPILNPEATAMQLNYESL